MKRLFSILILVFSMAVVLTACGGGGGGDGTPPGPPPDKTAPAIPAGLSVTVGDGQVTLDWTANTETDISGYSIYIGTTSGQLTKVATVGHPTCAYVISGLTNGTTYIVAIDAVDGAGNSSACSNEIAVIPVAPDVTNPTVVSASPANSAIGISRSPNISMTFSEAMDKTSAQIAFAITSPTGHTGVFTWTTDGKTMTFYPDVDFNYGETVKWRISTAAKDLSGNPMTVDFTSSFRVIRQATQTLNSVPVLDGVFSNTGDLYINAINKVGFTKISFFSNEYYRGFFSFNLSDLPSNLTNINSATFSVYQTSCWGVPYTDLGDLLAQSVDYGTGLEFADFDTPVLKTKQCLPCQQPPCPCIIVDEVVTLSTTDTAEEWKSASATRKVSNDWDNRTTRGNRSQYRVKFEKDTSSSNAYCYLTFGEDATKPPKLEITYEYP